MMCVIPALVDPEFRLHTKLLKTHLGHWDRRTLHLDALERAVKLHGGFEGLDHSLSLIIFW
jgi:hypothetical protein